MKNKTLMRLAHHRRVADVLGRILGVVPPTIAGQ